MKLGLAGRDLKRAAEMDATVLEVQFERSVDMRHREAKDIAREAGWLGVRLTVHAPYYGSIATDKQQKAVDAKTRILRAVEIARTMSSEMVVLRSGFYAKKSPREVYGIVRRNLEELSPECGHIRLGLETAGRASQFGTVEECTSLASELDHVVPVFNLASIHARTNGGLKTEDDFSRLFEKVDAPYCHFSGVKYENSSQLEAVPLEGSDFNYRAMLDAAAKLKDVTLIAEFEDDFRLVERALRP